MTEKELVAQLNNLKKITPDQAWLKSNRELLLTQISNSGANELSVWKIFIINLESLAKTSLQPAVALGAFVLVLLSGSLFSHQLFNNAKPNDSLYIARIISEKAKLTTILNSDSREKMAAQFAATHAQDIANTLANPEFNQEANQDQVARLNESFNKEIKTVKTRVDKLASLTSNNSIKNPLSVPTSNPDDQIVSAAENAKGSQGIQFSDGRDLNAPAQLASISEITSISATNTTLNASGSLLNISGTLKTSEPTATILDEARQLFEQKDYNKAVDKLKEVEEVIK